jgi:hypothetical protein
MSDDLVQLLIYGAIGLIGVIASAYRNKKKHSQTTFKPGAPVVPRNLPADPGKDFGPELGPLMELFDIPQPKPEPLEYETVESGPTVEEAGMQVDSPEGSAELAGMTVEAEGALVDKIEIPVAADFEEGQSDIQKMIAKYEAINKALSQEGILDDIASSEIVSVEKEESLRAQSGKKEAFFDPRKAIIYSEILKRKEF